MQPGHTRGRGSIQEINPHPPCWKTDEYPCRSFASLIASQGPRSRPNGWQVHPLIGFELVRTTEIAPQLDAREPLTTTDRFLPRFDWVPA